MYTALPCLRSRRGRVLEHAACSPAYVCCTSTAKAIQYLTALTSNTHYNCSNWGSVVILTSSAVAQHSPWQAGVVADCGGLTSLWLRCKSGALRVKRVGECSCVCWDGVPGAFEAVVVFAGSSWMAVATAPVVQKLHGLHCNSSKACGVLAPVSRVLSPGRAGV